MAVDERPEIAHGDAYRRPTAIESLGAAVGRALPEGALRRWLRDAYRGAIGLARGGRGIPASLPEGEQVRLLPAYRFVTWNDAEYRAFRASVRPGAVALDVGANVGAYSVLLGQWVCPAGRVYAFEPAPDTFHGLEGHIRLNGLTDIVVPVRAAAAGFTGRATLSVDGISGENRLAEGGGEPVEAVTLDDFCAREGITPSFIKIDVEGAELDVLRGARETIRRAGPGLALFMEMHPAIWPKLGYGRAEIEAELAMHGLRAEPLRPVADPWALEGECLRLVRV